MYRFLLSPKWLVGHVLVAGVAVLFVALGFWQLDRHEQRTTRNDLTAARMEAPPVDLDQAVPTDDDLAYRRVTITGHYLPDEEVLVTPRSWQGRAGHHALTPLVDEQGEAVLVVRGWVPFEVEEAPPPPPGEVRVEGIIFPDEPPVRFAPAIPDGGELTRVSRVDVGRLQRQVDAPLRPYYVQLTEQSPAGGSELPLLAEAPELDDGNHLPYAVQWFLFAAVGLIGYPALIRKTASERESPGAGQLSPGTTASAHRP